MNKEKINKKIKENEDLIKSLKKVDNELDKTSGFCPDSANKILIKELEIENSELKSMI